MKNIIIITLMLMFTGSMMFGPVLMACQDCDCCDGPAQGMDDCAALCCQPLTVTFAQVINEPVIESAYDFVLKPFLYSRKIAREIFHPPRHTLFL
jgi:hypothetical protein